MAKVLNQLVAIEKGAKERIGSELGKLNAQIQRIDSFIGLSKTYRPAKEGGETLPPETKRVQTISKDVLRQMAELHSELIDIIASKDFTNQDAKADIVVEGETIAVEVPAVTLLFLEKQFTDFKSAVERFPVLDPDKEWTLDEAFNYWKTQPIETHRTQKVPKVIVKYEATPQHPAQTELIPLDEIAGYWTTIISSGALSPSYKRTLLKRIDSLLDGIRIAREQANMQPAKELKLGNAIFEYLL